MNKAAFAKYASVGILIFGIACSTALPEVGSAGFYVLAVLSGIVFFRPMIHTVPHSPAAALPLAALAILAVALVLAPGGFSNLIALAFFAPMLLVGPIATTLRIDGQTTIERIAITAFVACVLAAGVGMYDGFILGGHRAGYTVNNPIHFGAVSLIAGFIALVGLYSPNKLIRGLALTAPLFAVGAVALSGSRGPLVAVPPMAVMALAVLLFQKTSRRLALTVSVAAAVVGVAFLAWLWNSPYVLELPGLGDIAAYLRDGIVSDDSIAQRLDMYAGGLNAWANSPLFGQGADFIARTAELSADPATFPRYDHLHSDFIDFVAIGGSLGLIAYVLFIAAMPVGAIVARGANAHAVQMLAYPAAVGYVVLGVTNANIGVIAQTILLATLCALITYLGEPAAQKQQ